MSGLTDLTKVCGLPAQQAAGCYLVLELTDVQGRATAFRIAPSTGGRMEELLLADGRCGKPYEAIYRLLDAKAQQVQAVRLSGTQWLSIKSSDAVRRYQQVLCEQHDLLAVFGGESLDTDSDEQGSAWSMR
jgi:hypothetical protein